VNLLDVITEYAEPDSLTCKVYGVVIGVVTDNKDPENLARVKVKFPWLHGDNESHWARLAVPMSGGGRGTWFLPEIDDEVLVVFEHGDVRFPYIIGSLWNGVDASPYDNSDGKNNLRVIKSRSGHELIFNDNGTEQKEQVEIHTKAGHRILLDDSAGQEKIVIKDKSGMNSITVDSVQNSIAIASQQKLSLKAQIVEIEAGAMMTVKAGATLTIQGALVKIN
jgi:uncharacterized protein involved in type VI secretion and phage assembly